MEIAHLTQTSLSEKACSLIDSIAAWLSTITDTDFEPLADDFQRCRHPKLREKIKPLLDELEFLEKVQQVFRITKPALTADQKFSVVRIPGPGPAPFFSKSGPLYIIPLRVEAGTKPTVSNLPLLPGQITYINDGVEVYPKLDLLFIIL
ncbi:hypothetical protein V491_01499 [Pseudogymnoascus sp. VKM F-3775]|nr:hypothetical protein V491_01499 [Pseudogymnoascus sp. VKM F-3775]